MKKILLIEDDSFLADIYSLKLREAGFDVSVAVDGEEGLAKIKDEKPDLVLLDIVLPKIDGWQILKKIRSDEDLKTIKVILLSNINQRYDVEKGIKLGADKYLIKAFFTPEEVIEEIKKLLE